MITPDIFDLESLAADLAYALERVLPLAWADMSRPEHQATAFYAHEALAAYREHSYQGLSPEDRAEFDAEKERKHDRD